MDRQNGTIYPLIKGGEDMGDVSKEELTKRQIRLVAHLNKHGYDTVTLSNGIISIGDHGFLVGAIYKGHLLTFRDSDRRGSALDEFLSQSNL